MSRSRRVGGVGGIVARYALMLCFVQNVTAWAQTPAAPNRRLPQVEPPRTELAFSTQPTADEIFRARVFEEPLAPVGGESRPEENRALASALLDYTRRPVPDDFSALTDFLARYPQSPWRAALLTDLGLEYYRSAYYSLALDAWAEAWSGAKNVGEGKGKAIADRAVGELAFMYARLGRMNELEALLKSVEGRGFAGPATEKITGAREGLWSMQNRPEVSFRCGPLALRGIQAALNPQSPMPVEIFNSASTQKGFSLPQVAELSKKVGMNYRMAFRQKGGAFVVPSVVHWKVGHYAALVRQEGNRYLLRDPTFRNDTWATKEALEAETSGYFLIPPGDLQHGWRTVDAQEGGTVWGKGQTSQNDPRNTTPKDKKTPDNPNACKGMAVCSVHLMTVNVNLTDEPVGYTPPVGPAVKFIVRYNHRDAYQPAVFDYVNFGPKWTSDWIAYIHDNPQNPLADVDYYVMGGGDRTFTGFDANTQNFAFQQYDQTLLRRLSPTNYEMISPDGSKLVFAQPTSSAGNSRRVFLSQVVDPSGNAVTLTYDANFRLVALTDTIGQVTTLSYDLYGDNLKITKVTDPFGRFATFDYDGYGRLIKITDVLGLTSQFTYVEIPILNGATNHTDTIQTLITPYGTNNFVLSPNGGNTRIAEITYADGSRERVEFNQSNNVPAIDPILSVPTGMTTYNSYLAFRNTFYWSRDACAVGYGDYSKARLYHWLHAEDTSTTAGALESAKEPLEGRVWYDYAGENASLPIIGRATRPTHIGRVLDDGTTQLYTYGYNGFGKVTNIIDPAGRTFSYVYATNGIDLLEVRQTRAGKNELLFKATYNAQHLPFTLTDAAGQTTTFTYNGRGQPLTETDPKNETTTFTYDTNGYLLMVDGPLPGTNDVTRTTYDGFGRARTFTDDSGYTVTFDYDALDRMTRMTFPDATFDQFTYDRLDLAQVQSRSGQQTTFEYDRLRQVSKRVDALHRETRFQWCRCGALRSLIDPMGRVTTWEVDVQGRPTAKIYSDGSKETYDYEAAAGRLRQFTDEKNQTQFYTYNRDDNLKSVAYVNSVVATPGVSYTYDPDYDRISSMTDGVGTTIYSYNPITGAAVPGAGRLACVSGPLTNATVTYAYDELGRRSGRAINGAGLSRTFDAAGRVIAETNVLGNFTYSYDGASSRIILEAFPNNLTAERSYKDQTGDLALERITHKIGGTPLSEFLYDRDTPRGRITGWSQQAGAQPASRYAFGYDDMDQLLSASVTNSGTLVESFGYSHDPSGNRLSEAAGGATNLMTYNSLNQISSVAGNGNARTNEWNAEDRLVAVNTASNRTEMTYDGLGRLAAIRHLVNGAEVSSRKFLWCDDELCEERDGTGANVTRRYFDQGMRIESGAQVGAYYYSRDHLGSIRELTDSGGNLRARYAYDPYGRQTQIAGDVAGDFGFAGMFTAHETGLAATRFRAYDPVLGRWLSRDPLERAEYTEGPNLYSYVKNNPVNLVDPLGLETGCCEMNQLALQKVYQRILNEAFECGELRRAAEAECKSAHQKLSKKAADAVCAQGKSYADSLCNGAYKLLDEVRKEGEKCVKAHCNTVCRYSSNHDTYVCTLQPK